MNGRTERQWRGAQFDLVHEERFSAEGKASLQITWSSLIERKSAKRSSSTREESFRQRDEV